MNDLTGTVILTNGDILAQRLQHILDISAIPWRENLMEGRVPPYTIEPENLDFSEHCRIRAEYMSSRGWGPSHEIYTSLIDQHHWLRNVPCDELVLWFDEDLFDQLLLAQICHVISTSPLQGRRLMIVMQGLEYTHLSDADILGCYQTRKVLATEALQWYSEFWLRFTEGTLPEMIAHIASTGIDPGTSQLLQQQMDVYCRVGTNGWTPLESTIVQHCMQASLNGQTYGDVYRKTSASLADRCTLTDVTFESTVRRLHGSTQRDHGGLNFSNLVVDFPLEAGCAIPSRDHHWFGNARVRPYTDNA